MLNLSEIKMLEQMLIENEIPFYSHDLYDGKQILYPDVEKPKISCIIHSGSDHYKDGLIDLCDFTDFHDVDHGVFAIHAYNIIKNKHKQDKSVYVENLDCIVDETTAICS